LYIYTVKRFLLYLLIAFIILGNTGVTVFTHHCEKEGVFTSLIAPVDDHCQDKEDEQLPSCCQKADKLKEDCCSDEEKIVKLSFEYHEYYDLTIPVLFTDIPSEIHYFGVENVNLEELQKVGYVKPPQKRSGRYLLIYHQLFQI
jgi:hypothetical protein